MRYLLEISYKGTRYAGFQVQENAITVQSEVQKALFTFFRKPFILTGSSRTDSGVHARQNYFHFDTDIVITEKHVYNLNAILPNDIVVKNIRAVADDWHSRFHATNRLYHYHLSLQKDVFAQETSWFYPYKLSIETLNETAAMLFEYNDFTSFSKRNTQTFTKQCTILKSEWKMDGDKLVYIVQANRFLRGMVRALVATQLKAARGKLTVDGFRQIIEAKDCAKADFSAPAHGLFLMQVNFDDAPAN